jgi:hypothetical protein
VLATIFSTEGGAPLANPFVSDGNGKWSFWADQGRYDIQFSGAGIPTPYTYPNVDVVPSAATLPDPGGNGFVVRTALGVTVARSLTQPAAGITITNPAGLAGNAIFTLANDLAALEGLGGTGYAVRTAADTWAQRTITGTANNIVITDGNGVAGNTVINIGANVVTNTGGVVTDNQLVRMDGTSGRLIQGSAITVADTSGNFSVPNAWQASSAAGVLIALGSPILTLQTPTTAVTGFSGVQIINAAQTQTSGVPQVVGISQTFNQGGTAGSDSLSISRIETAQGSGQHNFIRCLGGAAGTTVQWRVDRLGNIYQTANPAIIGDVNGNEQLRFVPTASAVNEWTFTNAATGGTPTLTITGGDTNPNGRIAAKGTGRIIIPGYPFVLDVNATPQGNVTTGLDPISSFTIVADTLANNLDVFDFAYGGTIAANDNDKRFQLTIDGQIIFDTGLLDLDGVGSNNQWSIIGDIVRISATSVVVTTMVNVGQIIVNGASTVSGNGISLARNVTLTVSNLDTLPVILLLSAEGTATDDIIKTKSVMKITQRT